MRERRWYAALQSFVADGGIDGKITVLNSSGFFVKQEAIISSLTKPNLKVQVKRVEEGAIWVGKVGASVDDRIDVTGYLAIDGASIEVHEQSIPGINPHDILNAVYIREPSVAIRTRLADDFGRPVTVVKDGDKYRLAVDASFGSISVNISHPSRAVIQNITATTHGVEIPVILPNNVAKFSVKLRGHLDQFRIAFVSGGTASLYEEVDRGNSFESPIINVPDGYTIYLMTEKKDGLVFEITSWVDPV